MRGLIKRLNALLGPLLLSKAFKTLYQAVRGLIKRLNALPGRERSIKRLNALPGLERS